MTIRLRDVLDAVSAGTVGELVHGKPYETVDGVTIVTVNRARVRVKGRKPFQSGSEDGDDGGDLVTIRARPVGAFVVTGGTASWLPAEDRTRIALFGEFVGLVATILGISAVIRRPPWPDLHGWR
jgi:hypothetical protein